ncbi:MAG: hypothetical protein HQ567_07315 [Candidatus Nealsonbacteria bacterium]|nr:hypothetical protein [Candidatus Nealsonbacteria bacterium]
MTDGPSIAALLIPAACLAAVLAAGAWLGRRNSTGDAFLLADRSLPWGSLGLSLSLAGMAAAYFCAMPNEAYWVGLKFIFVPAMIWTSLPIVLWCVVPLYGTLELDSVYEYLELRFNPTTRAVAAGVYLVGMLLLLGGLLVLPCRAMNLGTGLNMPVLLTLLVTGSVATLYTLLGGMKATVWTDVGQLALMALAIVLLLAAISNVLADDGGLSCVSEVAGELNRTNVVTPVFDQSAEWNATAAGWSVVSAGWSIWAFVPMLAIVSIFFFVADQSTLQRLLAARDRRDMTLSYLLGCGAFSLLVPAVMYVGLGLLAVYHVKAQDEMPAAWVVRTASDPQTGEPLIGPETVIDRTTIEQLVADRAILDPNLGQPYTDHSELLTARDEVNIDRLATRAVSRPDRKRSFSRERPKRRVGGERLLRNGGDQLLWHFVRQRPALAGVVAAALLLAAMAVLDSALNALGTVVVIDFHRRFGWAERWLARRCGKLPDDLDQTDELRLARPVVGALGAAVVVIAVVVAQFGGGLGYVLAVLSLFAGPLLGIFLLGLFTRRTTAPAATAALAIGIVTAAWATFGHHVGSAAIWPFDGKPLSCFWPISFGLAATLAVGWPLSFIVGPPKSRRELTGLVASLGRWGHLLEVEKVVSSRDEEIHWIETDDPPQQPWR